MNHRIVALAAAALLAAPILARADDAPPAEGACKADIQKFCSDVKPGGGAIIKCLKDHAADLSPECKARGERVKARMEKAKADMDAACGDDLGKLCKDVQPGRGALIKCLHDNRDQLSQSCKDFMAKSRQHFMAHHPRMAAAIKACQADRQKLCGDVKEGEGRVIACMKQHESELSDACKAAMGRHKGPDGDEGGDQGEQPEGKQD